LAAAAAAAPPIACGGVEEGSVEEGGAEEGAAARAASSPLAQQRPRAPWASRMGEAWREGLGADCIEAAAAATEVSASCAEARAKACAGSPGGTSRAHETLLLRSRLL